MKGKNEDFLTRTLKYAQRQKWPALLKAFRTAAAKVGPLPAASVALHVSPSGCILCMCHFTVKADIHTAWSHHRRHH